MKITQYIKVLIKIITILPVVIEGVKAIVARYKAINDKNDLFEGL